MTKTKEEKFDRWQTSYGTSLKDVKGLNNRLRLLLTGNIRKVDPKTGEDIPLGRNIKRGIIDPVVSTARAGLSIVKPLVKGVYEELYVNPEKAKRKEKKQKRDKYEETAIDFGASKKEGKELTIKEAKDLEDERGRQVVKDDIKNLDKKTTLYINGNENEKQKLRITRQQILEAQMHNE